MTGAGSGERDGDQRAEGAPWADLLLTDPADAADLADRAAERWATKIEAAGRALGVAVAVGGPAALRQRAELEELPPAGGTTSPGGGCRLLRCADSWVAVSLARPTDVELVPAWLALAGAPDHELEPGVARCRAGALAEAAAVVGLPVGVVGEVGPVEGDGTTVHRLGRRGRIHRPLQVLDLSALWAGPLCAHLLGRAGAAVTKVESTARPDASRQGNPHLFAALNGTKARRRVDLSVPRGIDDLRSLIRTSDVVVESSRPRALEQLGIVALEELARPGGPSVWVSITGHGRGSPRVAFGDDAAAAGGLVRWVDGEPRFAGDALADPLAGLVGAAAALGALSGGVRALIDVPLARVAAAAATDA